MAAKLRWCSLHQIGFNTSFEAVCPQCTLARIQPAKSYEFDEELQKPVDASGKPLKLETA